MKIITDEIKQILSPCVATIGCFDGLHRGHRFLIEQVCREARQRNFHSALITFPVHPRQVMQSNYRPQWLTCLPQKNSSYPANGSRLLHHASIYQRIVLALCTPVHATAS